MLTKAMVCTTVSTGLFYACMFAWLMTGHPGVHKAIEAVAIPSMVVSMGSLTASGVIVVARGFTGMRQGHTRRESRDLMPRGQAIAVTETVRNWLRRETIIERWCRETGLHVAQREADRYWVRRVDHSAVRYVTVRHGEGMTHVKFTAELSITFNLEQEPKGLFARVLLRSTSLRYTAWNLDIGQSCEGNLYLYAQLPLGALSASTFLSVVREMTDEILGFEGELRDKFRWGGGGVGAAPGAAAGVPASRQRGGTDIRFFDERQRTL